MFPELPTATKQPLLQLTEDDEELSEESSEDEVVLSEVVLSSSEVVVEDVLSVDADEPPSSLPQEIMVRLKSDIKITCKISFIFSFQQL